jgi:hypothetical protein
VTLPTLPTLPEKGGLRMGDQGEPVRRDKGVPRRKLPASPPEPAPPKREKEPAREPARRKREKVPA